MRSLVHQDQGGNEATQVRSLDNERNVFAVYKKSKLKYIKFQLYWVCVTHKKYSNSKVV